MLLLTACTLILLMACCAHTVWSELCVLPCVAMLNAWNLRMVSHTNCTSAPHRHSCRGILKPIDQSNSGRLKGRSRPGGRTALSTQRVAWQTTSVLFQSRRCC